MTPARRFTDIRRFFGLLFAFTALVTVLAASRQASAQQSTFKLDRLDIGGAPEDGYSVWRPRMGDKTRFYGQFALGYSLHPLRGASVASTTALNPSQTPNPVNNQLINYLSAGVEIMNRLSFGVTMPIVWFQNGNDICRTGGGSCQTTDINSTVPSDLRLDSRLLLFRDNSNTFHFGLAGSAWVASGDQISFTTDSVTHGAFRVMTELDFKSVILAVNTGIHFRPNNRINRLAIANEWIWAAGAYIPLRDGKVRLGVEIFGSTGLGKARGVNGEQDTTFTKLNTPLEWLGQIRFALDREKAGWLGFGAGTRLDAGYGAPDLRVLASLGYSFSIKDTDPNAPGRRYEFKRDLEPKSIDTDKDGIPDDLDLCPTVPEDGQPPDATDGCPAPSDRDHDGIPDDADKCPDQPEDKDGIDDLDGCPEDDFDQDGVPDATDACPREPGQPNPDPKKNGCPQFIRHVEGSTEIQILKKVEFATASATILPQSFPILDEVVNLLKTNKDITKVSVEGHTDSRGARDMNVKLSQSRAESVMRYLTSHGIATSRLGAQGYGPDKPIDTNDTDTGRQKNRRVEFHIQQ
jgi:outer membrane protein OmpA-like peptidoglycan-associated protein